MKLLNNLTLFSTTAILLRGSAVLAAVGIDGQPLSGSFDPTKCKLDRDDDLFKTGQYGGQCARCVTNNQCRDAYGSSQWYCCPFMKRCVNSGSMGCYDTAYCVPRCFSEQYPALKEECSGCDANFPDNWIKGCTQEDWAGLVSEGGSEGSADADEEPVELLAGDGSGMQEGVIGSRSIGGRIFTDPENVRDVTDKCWEVTGAASKYNGIYVPCSIAVVNRFFSYDTYRCWNKRFLDSGAETAYADPVLVASWKWFMPAAFPIYESFDKQEPVNWVVSTKWGSGTAVPTVTEVACADVDYGYVCENSGCSTGGSLVEDVDYGYYSRSNGDCETCVSRCTEDAANCAAVECGPTAGHCMWWREGLCDDSGGLTSFTCRRYNTLLGGGDDVDGPTNGGGETAELDVDGGTTDEESEEVGEFADLEVDDGETTVGTIGIDGQPLSGSFDPTKCKLDRDDDLFKTGEYGGQCARCVTNDQCRDAYGSSQWYCCPFMKRCVNSGSMGCYDTAYCVPRCFGEQYPALKEECSGCDSNFPDNWVKGCTREDWAGLISGSNAGGAGPDGSVDVDGPPFALMGPKLIAGDGSGMQEGVIGDQSIGGRIFSDPENVRDTTDKCWEVTGAAEKYNGVYVPCSIAVVTRFFNNYDNYRCWNKRFLDSGAETAYADPVLVASWKWFMPAAYPLYESFDKEDPVDWVVSSKWGSGTIVPTVTEVACADVDYGYVCENSGCSTDGSLVEGVDFGFYSRTESNCDACVSRCTEDASNCAAVECGPTADHCMWWREGRCDESGALSTFTCRRYNTLPGGGEEDELEVYFGDVDEEGGESGAHGPCHVFGEDGGRCQAAPGCTWDWDLYACVSDGTGAIQDPCNTLEGPECLAHSACDWDWDSNGCVSSMEYLGVGPQHPCQAIGSDGATCLETVGCAWDWDTMTCGAGAAPEVESPSPSEDSESPAPSEDSSEEDLGCSDKKTAKKCRKTSGCKFDKATRTCVSASDGGSSGADEPNGSGADDHCVGLSKPKCRRADGCVVKGKDCVVGEESESSADVVEDAPSACAGLKKSKCKSTAGCKFSKKECSPK